MLLEQHSCAIIFVFVTEFAIDSQLFSHTYHLWFCDDCLFYVYHVLSVYLCQSLFSVDIRICFARLPIGRWTADIRICDYKKYVFVLFELFDCFCWTAHRAWISSNCCVSVSESSFSINFVLIDRRKWTFRLSNNKNKINT